MQYMSLSCVSEISKRSIVVGRNNSIRFNETEADQFQISTSTSNCIFLFISRLVRVTEPGGPLGLVSSQGWYISSDVARMHPELASYRGLMNWRN